MDDRYAMGLQQGVRSDARELQKLRRIERARAEQHFAVYARFVTASTVLVVDSDRALALETDAGNEALRQHAQIRSTNGGTQ